MFCSECGTKCSENALFCPNCGKAFSQKAPTPPKEVKKKKVNPIAIIIPIASVTMVIFIVVAVLIIMALLPPKNQFEIASTVEYVTEVVEEAEYETEAVEIEPEYETLSTYSVVKSDFGWEDADIDATIRGGDLVCINDYDEFLEVCSIAEEANLKVFWVGAKRASYEDWYEATWANGDDMDFTYWLQGEPTYISEDGEEEYYLMVFKVGDKWYFNDAVENVSAHYSGKMGYIIEFTEYIEIYE